MIIRLRLLFLFLWGLHGCPGGHWFWLSNVPCLCRVYRGTIRIVRVVDGDTIAIDGSKLMPEPLDALPLAIRVRGVDCPERGHRARCTQESVLADAAMQFTRDQLDAHASKDIGVQLCSWDKYGGRILGDLWFYENNETRTLSDMLLMSAYAMPYSGKGTKHDWCSLAICRQRMAPKY